MDNVIVKLQEAYSACVGLHETQKQQVTVLEAREKELSEKEGQLKIKMAGFQDREAKVSGIEDILKLKADAQNLSIKVNSDREELAEERETFNTLRDGENAKIATQNASIKKEWIALNKKEDDIEFEVNRRVQDIVGKLKG